MTPGARRPAEVCRALLAALDAADGRRKSRKRDQTPDTLGLAAKRALLERAVADDPAAESFEAWLLERVAQTCGGDSASATAAMARAIFEEWRLAQEMREFAAWLDLGAPSDDAHPQHAAPAARAARE